MAEPREHSIDGFEFKTYNPQHAVPQDGQRKRTKPTDPDLDPTAEDDDLTPQHETRKDDMGFKTSAELEQFDVNSLTKSEVTAVVDDAKKRIEDKLFQLDPFLALRSALDYALWAGPDGWADGSYYNLVGQRLYLQMLSTLAKFKNLDLKTDLQPFDFDDDHFYCGLDMSYAVKERVSSTIDNLTCRRQDLRQRLEDIDGYMARSKRKHQLTEVGRNQLQESLEAVESELDRQIKKLLDYKGFLHELIEEQVHGVFNNKFEGSPLSNIQFEGAQEKGEQWDLEFNITLQEEFDPSQDRRFEINRGVATCTDESALHDAGERFRRKINIIKSVFEKFLNAKVEVVSDNKIRGTADNNKYMVTANATFKVSVPVASEEDISTVVNAISDVLSDLYDAEYGRLASRIGSTVSAWYDEQSR